MDAARLAKAVAHEDAARGRQHAHGGAAPTSHYERVGRAVQVKNRMPAPVQITAEQILREAQEFKEAVVEAPKQVVSSPAELADYRLRKRKEFEDALRRQRLNMSVWTRYATWEASQKEFDRARSIFERALDLDYRNQSVWIKYLDFEQSNGFIQHARNVFERAILLLPRVDYFWYKYVFMEEMLHDIDAARAIFARWMKFHPEKRAWQSYIKFELRYKQVERVRAIFQAMTIEFDDVETYLKYATFEERYAGSAHARQIYDLALREVKPEDRTNEQLLLAFAQFEERAGEYERARHIYRFALDSVPKSLVESVYKQYMQFEKMHGDRETVEQVMVGRRRFQYEQEIKDNPFNYDVWFDYIHLLQSSLPPRPELAANAAATTPEADAEAAANAPSANAVANSTALVPSQPRSAIATTTNTTTTTLSNVPALVSSAALNDVFERAVAQVPPVAIKRNWKRYIYFWIQYALHAELYERDVLKARAIYEKCLALTPHADFSFSKVWILLAELELRRKDLDRARKVLGNALGMCGKDKCYAFYIEMETQLGELDRVRKIFERWIERDEGRRAETWCKFAQFEERLEERERVRALLELALARPALDRPEVVWKEYIDVEMREEKAARARGDRAEAEAASQRVRALYERLLGKTKHVKVWISFAQYEVSVKAWERARAVFRRAADTMRERMQELVEREQQRVQEQQQLQQQQNEQGQGQGGADELDEAKEERMLLLTSWYDYEKTFGTQQEQSEIRALLPATVRKRRLRKDGGWGEYTDYVFPEQKQQAQSLRILEAAKRWKLEMERKKREEIRRAMDEMDGNGGSDASGAGSSSIVSVRGSVDDDQEDSVSDQQRRHHSTDVNELAIVADDEENRDGHHDSMTDE